MFQLDLKSRKPLYEQIIDQYKYLIVNSVLKPDEKIPSVRELAQILTINPNTIQKAYKELENQGYIYSTKGIGSFVSAKEETIIDQKKVDIIAKQLEQKVWELHYLGVDTASIEEILDLIMTSLERRSIND